VSDTGTRPVPEPRTDLTSSGYWEGVWRGSSAGVAAPLGYCYQALSKQLLRLCPEGASALELGCGGSVWLPMLARRGRNAWGIDYSEAGVAKARARLARSRVSATVIRGDLFDTGLLPTGRFDLVYSLGLLEHFADCRSFIGRLRELTKPGGHVLTTVPNLRGTWGRVQAALNRSVFDAHRLYSPNELDDAHTDGGLDVVQSAHYFGGICPLIVEYDPALRRLPRWAARGALAGLWASQQGLGWSMALLPQRVRNPPSLAGHILGVYRRPL
jgi:SAM-dependent methyltransferase